jgi:uroporphyrinogen-III decarboxylase
MADGGDPAADAGAGSDGGVAADAGAMAGARGAARPPAVDARLEARFARAREAIAAAYRHEPVERPPVLVGDVNYWITGEDPDLVPGDYFDVGAFASMLAFQEAKIAAHLARHDDIYLPFVFPWYGTGVVPSALGCEILFQPKEEPAVAGAVITEPAQVGRLVPPDPERDGLMPRVLRAIDHFVAHAPWPVSFTDNQGPLNIALNLVGLERLMLWMYDEPVAVHELMDFCTTVLIDWVRLQKARAGGRAGVFPHTILLPSEFGGVWISDDDCTIVSPALYHEFVVPYNSRVLSAFGGGSLHYCGSARHQLENFAATEGLVAINNWPMGDFAQVFEAQRILGDRAVIMVCDYTPLETEAYFRDLVDGLDPRGAIVATYPSPTDALRYPGGRIDTIPRDVGEVGLAARATIERFLDAKTTARRGGAPA